jgi:hypothetical protein
MEESAKDALGSLRSEYSDEEEHGEDAGDPQLD